MRGSLAALAAIAVIAGCGSQPSPAASAPVASTQATEERSPAAIPMPSPTAAPQQPSPDATLGGFIGTLTRYCDLGACCPALDVGGTTYALHLPASYEWRGTRNGFQVMGRDGQLIAAENATLWVRGAETGGDACFATVLDNGIEVVRMATAYSGGLVRTGVCLVLSTDEQVLELRFSEGWDYDRVGDRMVVRDAEGHVVMGEGDRIAVTAVRETEQTGSFCMVGDDIVRITGILEVSG